MLGCSACRAFSVCGVGGWTHPTLAEITAATIGQQSTDATPPDPAHYVNDPPF